jgi:hypothetical protein
MAISKKSFTILFSSAYNNGAIDISDDGTEFSVNLNHPIGFPNTSFDCSLQVIQATVWNSVFNITAAFQNTKIYYYHGPDSTLYTVNISPGLYSVSSLNGEISKKLINQGLPADSLSITGNESTQKTLLSFNYVGSYVDFTQTDTCRILLGFDSRFSPIAPTTIVGQSDDANNIAKFNVIESFLIKSDIITEGISTNQTSGTTIANIPITSGVNSQIVYQPLNPVSINATVLKGTIRNYISFRLTTEKGIPAPTNADYSVLIKFSYKEMI